MDYNNVCLLMVAFFSIGSWRLGITNGMFGMIFAASAAFPKSLAAAVVGKEGVSVCVCVFNTVLQIF